MRLTQEQRAQLHAWIAERMSLLARLRELGGVTEMARSLGVSRTTVYYHIDPVRRKLWEVLRQSRG